MDKEESPFEPLLNQISLDPNCREHSRTVWIRLLLLDSLKQLQQKKGKYWINETRTENLPKNNLKYNKWLRNEQKIREKLYLQDLYGTSGYN